MEVKNNPYISHNLLFVFPAIPPTPLSGKIHDQNTRKEEKN
jgi:hypothetical protein